MIDRGDEVLGVYVSVPFCRAKCSFCNFSSDVGSAAEIKRYVAALGREIRAARGRTEKLGLNLPTRVDTLYFGGGTPSLLQPAQLCAVFEEIRTAFSVDADAEVTMEAAPGQIAGELLQVAQEQGVNRISLGVQSFANQEAASVGRLHTREEALREIARLRHNGIAEVGIDLIAGLPHQTAATWQKSLEDAASSEATHLSVYMLEIDEDSRLGREVLAGGKRFHAHAVANDDLTATLYESACAWLPEHGFTQYEISNFARRKGTAHEEPSLVHQARHNVKYWTRQPYLGLGLDAHSMLVRASDGAATRFANSAERHDYELGVTLTTPAAVPVRDAFEETIFLGLRMARGLRLPALQESWPSEWIADVRIAALELADEGLMTFNVETMALTTRGRLLSNEVFGRLLESVPA